MAKTAPQGAFAEQPVVTMKPDPEHVDRLASDRSPMAKTESKGHQETLAQPGIRPKAPKKSTRQRIVEELVETEQR